MGWDKKADKKGEEMAEKEAFEYQRTRSWGTVAISLEIKKKERRDFPSSFSKERVSGGKCSFF